MDSQVRQGELDRTTANLVEGLGQLVSCWGFNKTIGWIYGLLYIRQDPMSLDDIAFHLAVSKGNVSINIREAERLGMVRKVWIKGDRKDFYEAEPNLWRIVRRATRERQKKEFDFALDVINQSLALLDSDGGQKSFAAKRLQAMSSFLKSINSLVNGLLALETLKGAAVQACPVRSRLPKLKRKQV